MDPKLEKKSCVEAGAQSSSEKRKAGIFECFTFLGIFFQEVKSKFGNQPKQIMNNNNNNEEELEEEQVNAKKNIDEETVLVDEEDQEDDDEEDHEDDDEEVNVQSMREGLHQIFQTYLHKVHPLKSIVSRPDLTKEDKSAAVNQTFSEIREEVFLKLSSSSIFSQDEKEKEDYDDPSKLIKTVSTIHDMMISKAIQVSNMKDLIDELGL